MLRAVTASEPPTAPCISVVLRPHTLPPGDGRETSAKVSPAISAQSRHCMETRVAIRRSSRKHSAFVRTDKHHDDNMAHAATRAKSMRSVCQHRHHAATNRLNQYSPCNRTCGYIPEGHHVVWLLVWPLPLPPPPLSSDFLFSPHCRSGPRDPSLHSL